ncbi:ABC transporter domain-containing protein [Ditylenchus destructor]|nr:ABC transporter domain-containing protein [Ditylenchus destructor]
MQSCPAELWPPNLCGYLYASLSVLLALVFLNLSTLLWKRIRPNIHQPLREGFLTIFFYFACACHIFVIFIPFVYYLISLNSFWSNPVGFVTVGLIIHSTFWACSLHALVSNRHYHELPLQYVLSLTSATILITTPLLFWSRLFPAGFSEPYTVFYIFEASFIYALFITVATKATLKQNYYSPWDNFISKCAAIWPYVWPKKSHLLQFYVFICFTLLIIGRVINVVVPLYSKWIVDALAGPNPFRYDLILTASFLKFLQGSGAAGGGFLNTLRSFLWIRIQQYTTIEIEVDMFKYLHQLSLKWHLSRKTGEVIRIMDRGTNSINTLLNYILFNVFPTITDIVLAAIFFFVNFNIYFGFLVIVTMTIYLAVTIALTEWRSKYRKEMNECENKSSSIGVDSLLNYETIKYYNAEDLEIRRYRDSYEIFQRAEYKASASLALLNLNQNLIIGIGLAGGSVLAAYIISLKNSGMTPGDYVLFTTYILQLYGPLNFFGTIYRTIQRSFIDMENMLDLFKQEIEIKDIPGAAELERLAGTIEFNNVTFGYKPDRKVLDNISFVVSPGETVALVGPSGSGKTTIVRLLFRLYETTGGTITFNGRDIRHIRLKSLRGRIGIVPQDTVLFNETIRYNIQYGRPTATDEEVEEAAKAAAIHSFIVSHPDGYNCLVGERGLKLSGGEKQRVAIARTILKQPEYILLDEATSALDSRTERSIQKYLFELCQRRTCVVVAHRLSTIVHADKILVLNAGRIVESGTHDELLSKNGMYSEMWRLQNNSGDVSSDEGGSVQN